jgi:hypothetical protein
MKYSTFLLLALGMLLATSLISQDIAARERER